MFLRCPFSACLFPAGFPYPRIIINFAGLKKKSSGISKIYNNIFPGIFPHQSVFQVCTSFLDKTAGPPHV
jgi:hypothetical protein